MTAPSACGCVVHPGVTHAEHMRALLVRMAKDKAQKVQRGVARAVAKVQAGEPLTHAETHAVQQALHALRFIRADLQVQLDSIDTRGEL